MYRLQPCLCVFAVSMMVVMPSVGVAQSPSETVLHSFKGYFSDGQGPVAGLIMDAQGNLYGTTKYGGANTNVGTVFEIAAGTNAETVLYSFGSNSTDGSQPQASLISDAQGNLYGTTAYGGANSGGTVFEIAAGTHTETVCTHSKPVARTGLNPLPV